MKPLRWMAVGALLVVGCSDQGPSGERFLAAMSGGQETVPVTTLASGTANLSYQNSALSFALDVQNMTGVTAVHIHAGAPGQDGPALVTLFAGPTTGFISGTLASGSVGPAQLTSVSMDSLLVLMRNGHAYVNVATTGRPAGEIRGQIVTN